MIESFGGVVKVDSVSREIDFVVMRGFAYVEEGLTDGSRVQTHHNKTLGAYTSSSKAFLDGHLHSAIEFCSPNFHVPAM